MPNPREDRDATPTPTTEREPPVHPTLDQLLERPFIKVFTERAKKLGIFDEERARLTSLNEAGGRGWEGTKENGRMFLMNLWLMVVDKENYEKLEDQINRQIAFDAVVDLLCDPFQDKFVWHLLNHGYPWEPEKSSAGETAWAILLSWTAITWGAEFDDIWCLVYDRAKSSLLNTCWPRATGQHDAMKIAELEAATAMPKRFPGSSKVWTRTKPETYKLSSFASKDWN
ncbi:hypothetical protein K504DRAFT_446247 [Pleomassaria siparia CBS 279.74]|uniref:Uncharacterized protein n=1 Tax=Pleomassaria siparia CBS 279.74 TaxID=1314801 RepID=A0A6G1KRB6_9PLEO|nr:hypothetical protein K504DRAFT_446247 [Pleomassaria siparia CBS 279.74]